MTLQSAPSSKLLRMGAAILIAATAEVAPVLASTTAVTSAANIPYSGISPEGVNMATGELILFFAGLSDDECFTDIPAEIEYGRYYGSMLAREGLAFGHLGTNWLGTYDWSLSVSGSMVTIVTNRGQRIQFQQSPVGAWDLVSPTYEKYGLDFVGSMWQLTHPGLRRVFLFDGTTLLLTQILDAHGNSLALSYSGGLLSQVSDGLGRMLTFSYDGSGRVTQVGDGTRVVSYAYTGDVLTGVADAEGHTWRYTYAQPGPIQGLLTEVTEPLGNSPLTQAYDLSGRVATQTDALGGISTYTWDGPDNLYVDALGNSESFLHDPQNRLSTLTDPAAGTTTFTYDPSGRLATMTRPLRDMTSFAYDPANGYPNMVSFADGMAINWGYSSHSVGGATLFDLATAGYPDGTTESYGRDASGNLTNFIDRGGFPWGGTYNSRGQLLTATNPTGGVTTFTYDPQGRPATARDNAGNTTQYTYDALSRLTQITRPDGPSRSFAYDNVNHVTGVTDERGKLSSYAYDADGRLITAADPLLETIGFVYDALDRVTQVVDPLGHATVYAYDPAGRLMSTTDRSGRTTSYQHDMLGRLTGVVDPMGGTTTFTYDADGRVVSAQDALGHAASFGHDLLDRITHITDPVGTGFDYTYDTMGRLLTANAPLGHTQSFTYDARGFLASYFNVTSETDYPRTPLGEVSQLTDPNRNIWPAAYDPQGRPTSAADPLGRVMSYTYDARSRVTHVALPLGAVDLTYDEASRIGGRMFSDGTSFIYGYDDANRLTGATGATFAYDAAGRMTSSNGLTMTYDNEGRITSETYAAGKVVNYAYDNRGLLTGVMDWIGGTTSFTHDPAGRMTGLTRPDGTSATYQYDNDNRTTGISEVRGNDAIVSLSITRDALGRLASIVRRQPLMPTVDMTITQFYNYDAASQINGLSYDPLGRLVSDGKRTFQWDGASRLTHYAVGADSPRFTYDAFGRVLSRTLGGATEQYVWNYAHGTPTLDAVYQGPTPSRYYVYTPMGLLLDCVDAATGARSFYHYDEAGNAAFLTNSAGSIQTEYANTPFGGMTALGQTATNLFTYGAAVGAIQLGSSGLFRVGSGIYDAQTMRMISGSAIQSGPAGVGDANIIGDPGLIGDPNTHAYDLAEASGLSVEEIPALHKSPRGPWSVNLVGAGPAQSQGSWVMTKSGPVLSVNMDALSNVEQLSFNFDKERKIMLIGYFQEPVSKVPIGIPIPDISPLNSPLGLVPHHVSAVNYGHQLGGINSFGASGMAEMPGNDMVVSLGASSLSLQSDKLTRYQAGTMAHELGHRGASPLRARPSPLDGGASFDPPITMPNVDGLSPGSVTSLYGWPVRAPIRYWHWPPW